MTPVPTCELPTAHGWDHHDGNLVVHTNIWLTAWTPACHEDDGNPLNVDGTSAEYIKCPPVTAVNPPAKYASMRWKYRSEWVLKYDAADEAGNEAEQIQFTVIVDDLIEPEMTPLNGIGDVTIEAVERGVTVENGFGNSGDKCKNLNLLEFKKPVGATDNVDGDIGNEVYFELTLFTSNNIGKSDSACYKAPDAVTNNPCLGSACGNNKYCWSNTVGTTHWEFDTNQPHGTQHTVVYSVHDHAGIFGKDGQNNPTQDSFTITIEDTVPPVITCGLREEKYEYTVFNPAKVVGPNGNAGSWADWFETENIVARIGRTEHSQTLDAASVKGKMKQCSQWCVAQQKERYIGSKDSQDACVGFKVDIQTNKCTLYNKFKVGTTPIADRMKALVEKWSLSYFYEHDDTFYNDGGIYVGWPNQCGEGFNVHECNEKWEEPPTSGSDSAATVCLDSHVTYNGNKCSTSKCTWYKNDDCNGMDVLKSNADDGTDLNVLKGFTTDILPVGEHTVDYTCNDRQDGNFNNAANKTRKIFTVDTTPPHILVTTADEHLLARDKWDAITDDTNLPSYQRHSDYINTDAEFDMTTHTLRPAGLEVFNGSARLFSSQHQWDEKLVIRHSAGRDVANASSDATKGNEDELKIIEYLTTYNVGFACEDECDMGEYKEEPVGSTMTYTTGMNLGNQDTVHSSYAVATRFFKVSLFGSNGGSYSCDDYVESDPNLAESCINNADYDNNTHYGKCLSISPDIDYEDAQHSMYTSATNSFPTAKPQSSFEFPSRTPGTYVFKYTCRDNANQHVSQCRTILNIDYTKPVVNPIGPTELTIQATRDGNYVDDGATCSDLVDGEIPENVEVSGDVVNLAVPDTYNINYLCTDSSGNSEAALRKVVVEDTARPLCLLQGPGQTKCNADVAEACDMKIEASFPYAEYGVFCTDDLDGELPADKKTITYTFGTSNVELANVNVEQPGLYTVEYTAKDNDNQTSVPVKRFVRVIDTLKPVITLKYGQTELSHGNHFVDHGVGGEQNPAFMAENNGNSRSAMFASLAAFGTFVALLGYNGRDRQQTPPPV